MSQYTEQQNRLLEHLDTTELHLHPIIKFKENIEDVVGSGARLVCVDTPNYPTIESRDNIAIFGAKFSDNQYLYESCDFALITIIVIFYSIVLSLFKKQFMLIISTFKSKNTIERLYELMDVNGVKFVNIGQSLFIVSFSYLISNILPSIFDVKIEKVFLFVATLLIILVSVLVRWVLNRSIEYITSGRNVLESLNILSKSYFSSISIILTPFSLSSLYFVENQNIIFLYLLVSIAIASILGYLFYTASFFFKQKISFLEYILYLCSAEIIPIATILIFLQKKFM
ncbi:MAG: DUF4271 domain-containing protein [Rikenellaceae bacterium]